MFKIIQSWLISFLHIQLIITLFSLPILIMWGLPISTVSLLGNLLFSPLLMFFIALCCMITLFEMFGFSHTYFDYALEQVSTLWYKILSWSSPSWLTGYPIKLLPVTLVACLIFYWFHRQEQTKMKQIYMSILLLCIIFIAKCFVSLDGHFHYDHMDVIRYKGHTFCIDHGAFSRKRSPQSWIDYTLLPDLVSHTGSPKIDTMITYKNNKRTYRAAKQLERQACIQNLHFPKKLKLLYSS